MSKQVDATEIISILETMATGLGTKKAVARQLKVSEQYLGDVMNGRRAIGKKILNALGYKRNAQTYSKREA